RGDGRVLGGVIRRAYVDAEGHLLRNDVDGAGRGLDDAGGDFDIAALDSHLTRANNHARGGHHGVAPQFYLRTARVLTATPYAHPVPPDRGDALHNAYRGAFVLEHRALLDV